MDFITFNVSILKNSNGSKFEIAWPLVAEFQIMKNIEIGLVFKNMTFYIY